MGSIVWTLDWAAEADRAAASVKASQGRAPDAVSDEASIAKAALV